MWMIDTGAARSILLFKMYKSIMPDVKFSLSLARSAISLADGQQAQSGGVENILLDLGTRDFQMHVVVADTEDKGILGMDFLSQVDSHIDLVKNQVSLNGEVLTATTKTKFTSPLLSDVWFNALRLLNLTQR